MTTLTKLKQLIQFLGGLRRANMGRESELQPARPVHLAGPVHEKGRYA
jgi:hypothetical protein